MTQRTFLDYNGLQRFLNNLKNIIPTKTSDLTNDSGFLTQHNPVDSSLSDTSENAVQNKVVKDALDGKSDTGHTHTASEVSGLATVATSGSYNDLSNTPTIPVVNNAKLTIQRNGTTVKTFTANASSNVTANITVPTAVSELTNDSGFLTSASSLDSAKLTGTIDIARLPKGALERLVTVANQTARFALTTSDVQLGDTVKQLDTGVMYIVTDESKLSSADGYTEYTAGSATSVPWSGVTGKPSDFTPSSHTHGNVTNDGKLPTASRALISDSSKNITVSSVSDTELGYLSGVTSAIQTQLNGKAASNHVHGNITNDGKVGATANVPLITGTGGVVQAGSFGNAANTFCEGNDSRLSDARTPVAHTHVTSEVLKTGSAITGSPQTNFFFKIASWEMGANQYFGAELLVQNSNYTQNRATVTISVRTSSSYTLAAGYLYLSNDLGFNVDQFYICYKEENNKVLFELYHYMPSTWNGIKFSVISECLNKGSLAIELFNTMTVYNRISSDAVADLPTEYTVIEAKYLPLSQDINPSSNNTRDLGASSYKWRKVYSDDVVHTSGDESVSGTKSFNSDLNLNYASTDVDDIVNSVAGSATLDNFVHMTGNETVNGIKSFPDGVIANVTGAATSATNDGSGNVISTTYGKLGAYNIWTSGQRISCDTDPGLNLMNSSYEKGTTPNSSKGNYIWFTDKNNTYLSRICHRVEPNGSTILWLSTCNYYKDGVLDPTGSSNTTSFILSTGSNKEKLSIINSDFRPDSNGQQDFGSSDYQWKSVYAQTYYYNGTPWGLDKGNIWTQNQAISNTNPKIYLKNTLITKGVIPSSNQNCTFMAIDSAGEEFGRVLSRVTSAGATYTWLAAHNYYKNGALDTTGTDVWANVTCYINSAGVPHVEINCDVYPNDGVTNANLGTSTNKWKSFNGLNPGALSLPDYTDYEPINFSQWDTSGALSNTYTPDEDGLLFVNIKDAATNSIFIYAKSIPDAQSYSVSAYGNGSQGIPGRLSAIIPVIKGITYAVVIKASSVSDIYAVTFFPALGNV